MNINKNLIKITNDLSKNYLNFEYITSVLRENYENLILLGNKRHHFANNQYTITQNENKLEYLNYINNNLIQKNIENKKNLLEINSLRIENINIDKNKDKINHNDKIFIIEKIKKKKINENNNNYIYVPLRKLIKNNIINLNDKEIFNNEKQVKKNNKNVYINKFLIKKTKTFTKKRISKIKRNSKYRGVSKNGAGWQVLLMINNNKPYIGTYSSEELAARIYDIASIQNIGIKSKTNFLYKSEQIDRILNVNIDFKSPNISKVISELINNY